MYFINQDSGLGVGCLENDIRGASGILMIFWFFEQEMGYRACSVCEKFIHLGFVYFSISVLH